MNKSILPILFVLTLSSTYSQQLPLARRILAVTPAFLGSVQKKVDAIQPGTRTGSVLIVFRTSEQGAVIDARSVGGPRELQQAALEAIDRWRFRATSIGGQPVQVHSAVIFDFTQTPPAIQVPTPMTALQLAPGLRFECLNGLLHQDPSSLKACEQQLRAVDHDSRSTSMDRFTAHDEYGLALLTYGHLPDKAVEQFAQAFQLASTRLASSDAEWAYVYWHCAIAEDQIKSNADAERDFGTAERGLQDAQKAIGNEAMASYYRGLLGAVVKQHIALLESENKRAEAEDLRNKFAPF